MIILKDITELVRGEHMKSMQRIADMMIASTSHDMRTPLNTVISMHKLIET